MENNQLLQDVALKQAELLGRFNTFIGLHAEQHKEQTRQQGELTKAIGKVEGSCATMAIAISNHNQADRTKESSNRTFLAIISIAVVVCATAGGIISQVVIAHGG